MNLVVEIMIQTSLLKGCSSNVSLKKIHSEKNLTNLSPIHLVIISLIAVVSRSTTFSQLLTILTTKSFSGSSRWHKLIFWPSENEMRFSPTAFSILFSLSSLCSNGGFKYDEEEEGGKKQRGADLLRFGAFRREHVAFNRRTVCKTTQIINSQQVTFSTVFGITGYRAANNPINDIILDMIVHIFVCVCYKIDVYFSNVLMFLWLIKILTQYQLMKPTRNCGEANVFLISKQLLSFQEKE